MKEVVKDVNGRILFFSPKAFYTNIILNKGCFICGIKLDSFLESKEHVLPNWILRDFNAHNESIQLPNNEKHRYGSYTIPCCSSCNGRMGREIEDPISMVVRKDHNAICDYIAKNGPFSLYTWFARIFLKAHLKDRDLRKFIDPRKGSEKIGDTYKWERFYLPFCFSREFYTNTKFEPRMMGSFFVLPLVDNSNDLTKRVHYLDDTNAQVLLFQIRDTGFIASFNDFGIAHSALEGVMKRIDQRPLNPSQLAELAAHVATVGLSTNERPTVFFIPEKNEFQTVPPKKLTTRKMTQKEWGERLSYYVGKLAREKTLQAAIQAGSQTFLWNKDGSFNTTHLN